MINNRPNKKQRCTIRRRVGVLLSAAVLSCCMIGCSNANTPLTDLALSKTATMPEKGTLYTGTDLLQVENENIRLQLDPVSCIVEVTNKADGSVWASNPPTDYTDPIAAGSYRTDLKSQLLITYTTGQNATQRQSNSFSSSVNKKAFQIYQIENGFRVHYTFKEGFMIPVAYRLEDDSFVAMVLYEEIEETEKNLLNEITLLPYFGVAGTESDGYLFVPDGSGSLIRLNNGKVDAPIYKKPIYGEDPTLETAIQSSRQETIRIPVFGMKRDNGAFAAIVSDGDGLAYVQATVSGGKTALNSVCVSGIYRVASLVYMFESGSGSRNVLYNAEDPTAAQSLTVRYTFLSGDTADYSGMAKVYRDYLRSNGLSASSKTPPMVHVDLYGEVAIQKSFLGLQYKGQNTLTAFHDAEEILDSLHDEGVKNISLAYRQYGNDFLDGKAEVSLHMGSALGGSKGWKQLVEAAQGKGDNVSLHANIVSLEKSGNGASQFFDTAKNINLGTAEIAPRLYHSNAATSATQPYYLIAPMYYEQLIQRLNEACENKGINDLYFTETAQTLISDYNIGGIQRQKTIDVLKALFDDLSGKRDITMSEPNAYLFPYVSLITDLPISSSRHILFDEDIPFLQLVLKGLVPYTATALNESSDCALTFLRQVETMSGVRFEFIGGDASLLLRTDMIHEYALSYEAWKQEAVQYSLAMEAVQQTVAGAQMTEHVSKDGLAVTQYDNGVTVYVNYTESSVEADLIVIEPQSYVIVRNGQVILKGNDKGEYQ